MSGRDDVITQIVSAPGRVVASDHPRITTPLAHARAASGRTCTSPASTTTTRWWRAERRTSELLVVGRSEEQVDRATGTATTLLVDLGAGRAGTAGAGGVGEHRPCPAAGRGDASGGLGDHLRAPSPTTAFVRGRRRALPAGEDAERDAGPDRRGAAAPAPVRLRRLPRAALAARRDAPGDRGGAALPRPGRRGAARRRRAPRGAADGAAGHRPADPGPDGRPRSLQARRTWSTSTRSSWRRSPGSAAPGRGCGSRAPSSTQPRCVATRCSSCRWCTTCCPTPYAMRGARCS